MPLNSYDIEQLEKYLSGKLSKEESDALAHRLKSDAELSESLDELRMLKTLIELKQEEKLASTLQDIFKKTPYDLSSFLRIHVWKIIGITILLSGIGLTLFILLQKRNFVEVKTTVPDSVLTLSDSISVIPPAKTPASVTTSALDKELPKPNVDTVKSSVAVVAKNKMPDDTDGKIKNTVEPTTPVAYVPVTKTTACSDVQWPEVTHNPACTGKSDGVIRVLNFGTIQCSLNDTLQYSANNVFEQLEPGLHTLFMKHKNGCRKTQSVTVETKECVATIRASFAPDAGERWEIPFKNSGNEKATIRDIAGKIVFETSSENFWTGNDMNGYELPAAAYHVSMESSGNIVGVGTVTILR